MHQGVIGRHDGVGKIDNVARAIPWPRDKMLNRQAIARRDGFFFLREAHHLPRSGKGGQHEVLTRPDQSAILSMLALLLYCGTASAIL